MHRKRTAVLLLMVLGMVVLVWTVVVNQRMKLSSVVGGGDHYGHMPFYAFLRERDGTAGEEKKRRWEEEKKRREEKKRMIETMVGLKEEFVKSPVPDVPDDVVKMAYRRAYMSMLEDEVPRVNAVMGMHGGSPATAPSNAAAANGDRYDGGGVSSYDDIGTIVDRPGEEVSHTTELPQQHAAANDVYSYHHPAWALTTNTTAHIPHIIHQSWKSYLLPPKFIRWSKSFQKHHPTWTYILWSDQDNEALVRTVYPQYYDTYKGLATNIMRADFVRAMYMHHHGGVYADLDTYCLQPMDAIVARAPVLLAEMSEDGSFLHNIPNAWMASVPGHPFWIFFMELIDYSWKVGSRVTREGPEAITGPVMLKRAVDEWNAVERKFAYLQKRSHIHEDSMEKNTGATEKEENGKENIVRNHNHRDGNGMHSSTASRRLLQHGVATGSTSTSQQNPSPSATTTTTTLSTSSSAYDDTDTANPFLDLSVDILSSGVIYIRDWHNHKPKDGNRFDRICNFTIIHTPEGEKNCLSHFPYATVLTFWTHTWERK